MDKLIQIKRDLRHILTNAKCGPYSDSEANNF